VEVNQIFCSIKTELMVFYLLFTFEIPMSKFFLEYF